MEGMIRRGPLSDLTQYINPDINNRVQNAIGSHTFGVQRKTAKPDTYKTVMCQAWLESMKCAFGENCKFAHGEHELRPVRAQIRNNLKYKTKLCDKYTTTGICPYGSRCLFIHPAPSKPVAKPAPAPLSRCADQVSQPAILQQQLEMIRQQYGPNSLPDYSTAPAVQQLWGPPAFFDQSTTASAFAGAMAGQPTVSCASVTVSHQQTPNLKLESPPSATPFNAQRRSFSASSVPSSAFGSSNSLGSTGQPTNGNMVAAAWPWADDLTLAASLSPTSGRQHAYPSMSNGPVTPLQPSHLSFHNSMPAFASPPPLPQAFSMMRSAPQITDHDDLIALMKPLTGMEEQGEQLARSVARALEIDL